ncbi:MULTISPECIES: phage major capsid protein [unclassified Clostridioides]|uniref:phage major capsid protein n=1 Tax=unclassified Clostridioides TaxID=2635829 RepID=UPI001D0F6980|nr:phage major capsid protein [Clostridioides sp. ES-S-0001-02]MCC0670820.1 phage major capsid protein [Clostridioides sp. ES-S-0145-01]UDN56762.1 phage major capsid protein [Clostridioides sp. ES-S-0010-02]
MAFKKYLQRVIESKEKRERELREQIKKAETIEEVRALGGTLDAVLKELQEAKDELEGSKESEENEENQDGNGEEGEQSINTRSFKPIAAYGINSKTTTANKRSENILDSMEYRQAFKEYVQTGKWHMEKRANEVITSDSIGKIIPNTIMKELIKELKTYGQLYNKVRKLNIQGGVEFPISELVPIVKWIGEEEVSDTQKAPTIKATVSFSYYIAEARISQSLLSSIVSLPILESEIAKLLAEAFIKEFDNFIINGTGVGQPKGILNDDKIKSTNKLNFTDADIADWTQFRKKLFAKIPLAYRGQGVLVMTVGTWESNIMTLRDDNNRPLYTETYDPITGNLTCRFNGREVILVEPDILKDYDTAAKGEAFMIYFRPQDYAINSNLEIGFTRYFNPDTNKWQNKGLTICDGKLIDVNGVYILQKDTVAV